MARKRLRCFECFRVLASEESYLVHSRYCSQHRGKDDTSPSRKRLQRTGLFSSGLQGGLGPGAAIRREDEGVMIAGEEAVVPDQPAETQPLSAGEGTTSDDVEVNNEWTSEASEEEVVEALRRVLLGLGSVIGEKQTDLLIRLMRHPSFCSVKFNQGVSSFRDLREGADQDLESSLRSLRFEKKIVTDARKDATAGMWLRDPVDVVKRQVAQLSFRNMGAVSADENKSGNLYTRCFEEIGYDGERRYSHPMSTDLAASVSQRVRAHVMHACAAGEEGVGGWNDGYDFVLFLQVYSDKSKQTIKTSSHAHLPLHVALLNTSLSMKEKMICAGDCVVGYMPTTVKWKDETAKNWTHELVDATSGRGSRNSRMRILQSSLETCLSPLLSRTVAGFTVVDSNGTPKRCHPVLWSYVTDLPEGWDVSSSVWHRCSRCHVPSSELHSTKQCYAKDATISGMIYDDLDGATKRVREAANERASERASAISVEKQILESMREKGVYSNRPFLLSLGENYGIDMYKSLRYEAMHNIHLGLTRTLLNCISFRLQSSELRSSEFPGRAKNHPPRMFKSIRTKVLQALNVSLELFDRQTPTIDFKVSHRSGGTTEKLNGLFHKTGVAPMLEAKDYYQILQVMPFLAVTCDRMCGEPGTTTRVFVQYVELVYDMLRVKQKSVAFSAGQITEVRRKIEKFMKAVTKLYGEHTSKGMAIPKMHALMHVADDIEDGGALSHYRADAYESSHKKVKSAYKSGCQRGDAGQAEALMKMAREDFRRLDSGKTDRGARVQVVNRLSSVGKRARGARTRTKVAAVENDAVVLSRPNAVISAYAIQKWIAEFCEDEDSFTGQKVSGEIGDLASDLGRPSDFKWFMNKLQLGGQDSIARSTSATVPGYPYPEVVKSSQNKKMLVTVDRFGEGDGPEGTVQREVQRLVAAHSFHGSPHRVQMFVMIGTGTPEETKSDLHSSESTKYTSCTLREVYVAKVLALLTVRRNVDDEGLGQKADVEEVALVQYLDVCTDKHDDIEKALGCVKLKWAQEYDEDGMDKNMDSMLCQYDIVDIGTIRGVLHVVRGDYGLGDTQTYHCEGDRHWSDCWFYINRFKVERRGAQVFMDEE